MKKLIGLVLAVMLALSAISAFAAEYTDKDTVKKVQQALNDAGYDCGTPDGAAGKKTKAAITSYQTDKGLTVTGVIDDELLISLELAEAETAEEAPAEAETAEVEETAVVDEGYTFQGIPWGSSPEEVETTLVENGLIEAGSFEAGSLDVRREASAYYPDGTNEKDMFDMLTASTVDGIGSLYRCEVKKEIGGFQPAQVTFFFIYKLQDGSITDELDLTMVNIIYPYNEALFADLSTKLKGKYGDWVDKEINQLPLHSWYGGNDTVISLFDVIGYDYLIYAKADDYITVQQIMAINEANKAPVADAGL